MTFLGQALVELFLVKYCGEGEGFPPPAECFVLLIRDITLKVHEGFLFFGEDEKACYKLKTSEVWNNFLGMKLNLRWQRH